MNIIVITCYKLQVTLLISTSNNHQASCVCCCHTYVFNSKTSTYLSEHGLTKDISGKQITKPKSEDV